MADQNFLTGSLQESLLTLLAFDDQHGKQVMGVIDLKYFDRPYRDLAEKIVDFRTKYRKPPGVDHLDDLFDTMLERGNTDDRRLIKDMLESMLRQSRGLNAEYVANKTNDFIRRQTLKDGLVRAGERISQGGENTDDEVSAILEKALKTRHDAMRSGTYLSDSDASLSYLDHPAEVFRWAIPELDKRGLGPTRKELLLYIAARKRGKTWAMIQLGKVSLIDGAKVCHISLEMSEPKVIQRYHQSLFGVAKRPDRSTITRLELDEFHNVVELRKGLAAPPRLNYQDPDIRRKIARKITQGGIRFGNLVVKDFPSGSMTIGRLNSYLDFLDAKDNFVPDLLIIDYPDLFALDAKNLRTSTGQVYVGIRGLLAERNMAGAVPTQGNRDSTFAREVDETQVAEDISKVATADTVITYSQTKAEKAMKLARLTCTNARNDQDGFSVLLSQNYDQGQFALASAPITSKYYLALKQASGDLSDGDNED